MTQQRIHPTPTRRAHRPRLGHEEQRHLAAPTSIEPRVDWQRFLMSMQRL